MNAIDSIQELIEALNAGGYGAAPSVPTTKGQPLDVEEFEFEMVPNGTLSKKDPNYPHTCPRCKGPAYIGLNKVDCKAKC